MMKFIIVLFSIYVLIDPVVYGSEAKIIKVDKNSNRILVNRGDKDQVRLQDEVCVFINNGIDFYCGKVSQLSSKRSLVTIKSRRLKKGMTAYFLKAEKIAAEDSEKFAAEKNPFSGRSVHGDFVPSR